MKLTLMHQYSKYPNQHCYFKIFILDLGVERGIKLEGMTEPQILKALEDLVKAGQSLKA